MRDSTQTCFAIFDNDKGRRLKGAIYAGSSFLERERDAYFQSRTLALRYDDDGGGGDSSSSSSSSDDDGTTNISFHAMP
eukprot:jgi/Psemu1/4718/gm1.4718_g